MGLNYEYLDDRTRALMIEEIERDIAAGRIDLSRYLSDAGREDWPSLLLEAARSHDDDWLARQLALEGRLRKQAERRTPKGDMIMADVPFLASHTIAEGEFNRFYIRALCRRALDDGRQHVEVYRARDSKSPREQSEKLIGRHIAADVLLNDLRNNNGVEAALGLARPNSGLSVTLVKPEAGPSKVTP